MKKRRPFLVWLIFILFLVLGWLGVLRSWQSVIEWNWLTSYGLHVSPLYLAASGAGWAAAGLLPAIGIWFRRRWSLWAGRIAAVFAASLYWADRLLIAVSPSDRSNLFFSTGLTAVLVFYVFGVLSLPMIKQYLGME